MASLTHSSIKDGPTFGHAANVKKQAKKPMKQVLLLGSGFVAGPAAEYIMREPSNCLTVACRTLETAQKLIGNLPDCRAISLDVDSTPDLEREIAAHDLVISLVPYIYHAAVIKAAIKSKTNVVTTSYVSPAMRELDEEAKKAGIVVMNEIGVDPGIDHIYAIKTIDEVHEKGGKVKEFHMYCGAFPAPECADNPLGYKFSWSPRGGLLALSNSASYIAQNKQVDIAGKDLMSSAKPCFISPAFAFVAFPNRNTVPFREWYRIPEAETVFRGTLRYQGFTEFVAALIKMGWFDQEKKEWLKEGITWAEVMRRTIGADDPFESSLIAQIKSTCVFPDEAEANRIISGLRWMGLFSSDSVKPRAGNLFDTLCAQLETLMAYEAGERDLLMMQEKFVVQWKDGTEQILTNTLQAYGTPNGHSAMARLVGVPCGIATQLVLDGVINQTGIVVPYSKEICDPIRELLEVEGIGMVERVS